MPARTLLAVIALLPLCFAAALNAQITSNPLPAPVEKRGLAVEIRDVLRCRGRSARCRPIRT
jgi:hypothetical protein